MLCAVICREFKWTWQEYQEQPAFFIDMIIAMIQAEAEAQEKNYERN
jgi:hypothetical protein